MFFVFLNIAVRYGGISSFTLFDFSSYLLTVYSPGIKAPQANKISKLGPISSVRSQVILIHKDGCTRLNGDEIELIELKNELINWRLGIDNYSIFRNPVILFIDENTKMKDVYGVIDILRDLDMLYVDFSSRGP